MNKPTTEQSPLYAGMDISKEMLDLSLAGESPLRSRMVEQIEEMIDRSSRSIQAC
jgi:hypothetical protein